MATGNILSAQINVTAPGAKEAFESVAKSASAVNSSLTQLGAQGVLSVKSIQDALAKFKVILSKTTDPAEIQKLNIAISALQNKMKDLPQTFEKVHVSSQRASTSALNLSHSFGLIPAEAAHITDKFESLFNVFEQMKEKTGSTAGAFSALTKTLGSTIGIGLAVTALTFLAEELFNSDDALKQITKDFDRVKDSIESMNDALEVLGNDLDFIKEFRKLVAEIAGTKGAALELINLDQQKINDKVLDEAIKEDLAKIEKSIQTSLQNINVLAKSQGIDLTFTSKGLVDESIVSDAGKVTKKYLEIFNALVTEKNKLNDKLIKIDQDASLTDLRITKSGNDLQEEQRKKDEVARKRYLQQLKEDLDSEERLFKGLAEGIKAVREIFQRDILKDQKVRLNVIADINLDTLATDFGPKEQNIGSQLKKRIEQLTKNNPILIKFNIKPEVDDKEMKATFKAINDTIQTAARDLVSTAAESIGEALASGDITKGIQSLVNVVADALSSLGKQFISIGVTAQLAKKALQFLFDHPALAIAAGVALQIVAGALRASVGHGVKGFASGGYTGPGGKYDVAGVVHRDEFVFPKHAVKRLGVGYLNNLAFGGNVKGYASGGFVTGGPVGCGIAIEVTGQNITRGQDIVTVYKAALRSQGRLI